MFIYIFICLFRVIPSQSYQTLWNSLLQTIRRGDYEDKDYLTPLILPSLDIYFLKLYYSNFSKLWIS